MLWGIPLFLDLIIALALIVGLVWLGTPGPGGDSDDV